MDQFTQELLALAVVALVAARLVWRWLRRKPGSCGGCASGGSSAPKENTLHFHPRRPRQ